VSSLAVGGAIPLSLQLPNGESNKFPRAIIYNADRTVFAGPIDLSHNALGEYKAAATYSMPSQDFIVVQYIVYTDAGHTTEDTDTSNGRVSVEFTRQSDPSQINRAVELEAEFQSIQLEVEFQNVQLDANIAHVELNSVP
jgi:hypothetical protein